jgi:hypothetical protein
LPWVWDGYIAKGFSALLTGLWKAGKTTLLARLIRALERGGEVATAVVAGRVLVVSEESALLWAQRRDELGIGDHASFLCRPLKARPDYPEWLCFVNHLAELAQRDHYDLVIFDTISAFMPVRDENDAAQVLRALAPLVAIMEAGAGLLLVHHPRKGDADEGQASRGSGALPGWVDCIVELRRFDRKDRQDRRRTLTAYSRFDQTPAEVVVELAADGYYRAVGSKADATRADRLVVVRDLLPTQGPGLTADEIRQLWPEGEDGLPKPSKRTLERDLRDAPGIGRSGAGTKGDPFRFSTATPQEAGLSGIESNGEQKTG